MTRLDLISHLTARLPRLGLDSLHVYCLVSPGTCGFVTAQMIQKQVLLDIRMCQRALVRLDKDGLLIRQDRERAPEVVGRPPAEYRLTPKGAALVKELLAQ